MQSPRAHQCLFVTSALAIAASLSAGVGTAASLADAVAADAGVGAAGKTLSATARPVVRPYVPRHAGRVELIAHELLQYDGYTKHLADTRFLAP